MALTNIRLSLSSRSVVTDAVLARINAGVLPGRCRIYSGSRPVNPDDALGIGNVLLADFALLDPAFDPAVNGVALMRQIVPPVFALNTGIGTWFRITDSDLNVIFDGLVSSTDAALIVNTVHFVAGLEVFLGPVSYTTPVGQ